MSSPAIAVLLSDLHLRSAPPINRAEDNWFEVMDRTFAKIRKLAGGLPVFCGGDIFDKPYANTPTIAFALDVLPPMYAVPGQHDLPDHNYALRGKSAYGVLEKAGRIITIEDCGFLGVDGFVLSGAPWGHDIPPCSVQPGGRRRILLAHRYVYNGPKTCYPGAPESGQVKGLDLDGYDVALFGDNHIHFKGSRQGCTVWNNGGVFHTKIDERGKDCVVGVLHADGTIKKHRVDEGHEWHLQKEQLGGEELPGFDKFMEEIDKLAEQGYNYEEAVRAYVAANEIPDRVKNYLLRSINDTGSDTAKNRKSKD